MASAEAAFHTPSSYGPRICRAVIDLGGDMMRDALCHKISPSSIVSSITGCRLNAQQLTIISNAQSRGDYNECDITLLYALLRNCTATKIALRPTNGCRISPAPSNVTLGDDLERIRLTRNKVYGHVATTSIPHSIYTQHMDELQGICFRMDTVHRGQLTKLSRTTWTYSQMLNDIQICCMDADMESKYIDEIKRLKEEDKKQERAFESVNERLDELSTKCDENKEFTEKLASEVQKRAEITEKLASEVQKQADSLQPPITNIGQQIVQIQHMEHGHFGGAKLMIRTDGCNEEREDKHKNCLTFLAARDFDKLLVGPDQESDSKLGEVNFTFFYTDSRL